MSMDRISTAAGVVGLVSASLDATRLLRETSSRHEYTAQTVSTLQFEIKVIMVSLTALQIYLLEREEQGRDAISHEAETWEEIDPALTGYSATLSCIEEEIRNLEGPTDDGSGKEKAKVAWKEHAFQSFLWQLRGQHAALVPLLRSLQK